MPGFDARVRPWYLAAVEKGEAAWSTPYVLITQQDLAIAASLPVYDASRRLRGVLSVDLFLGHFGAFLRSLEIGETGEAFIVERSGLLVASSTSEKPYTVDGAGKMQRLSAADSTVALLRDAYGLLAGERGSLAGLKDRQLRDERIGRGRYFLSAAPFGEEQGLDWVVVVAIPESDFMARITQGNRATILLATLIAAAAAAVGFLMARRITRPLERSNQALERAYEDLKRAQGRLVQAEKMASIGQLAAGIAHEINNPMAYIKSNLTTMQRYVQQINAFIDGALTGGDPESLAEENRIATVRDDISSLVAESLEGSARVQSIVSSLKDFAHLGTGEVTRADVSRLLDATLQVIWNQVKYKAEVRKDYGELPPIRCYAQRLNQVFLNILLNAVQAIEVHGVITIATRREGDTVSIRIADTGMGIPPEILGRIFEPFFTTKEAGKGTGLGLSVSYDIVKSHGGEIRVESTPGTGTAFTIILPIEPVFPEDAANGG